MGKVQEIYGVPISYEDTRHVHESELGKSGSGKWFAPEQISITYTVTPPPPDADLPTRKAMVGDVVKGVVAKYNAARGTEVYQITETENGFHVIPRQFLDTSGKMEDFHPILDTPITIAPGERTVKDIFDEISKQIDAATGKPRSFTISFRPNSPPQFLDRKTSLSASNEPARSVFDRVFKEVQGAYPYPNRRICCSWELNSWPGSVDGGLMFIYFVFPPQAH